MGKISNVFYTVISPDIYTMEQAAEYFFHTNVLDLDPMFHKEYEEYEEHQIKIRGKVISDAINKGVLKNPNTSGMMLVISSTRNAPILVMKQ